MLVVGGGISGLHTAASLNKAGIDCHLVEARDRLGGRILSMSPPASLATKERNSLGAVDLGPSWFWPEQSHMASLIRELHLGELVFEQYSEGDTIVEYGSGRVQRGVSSASMAGSYRITGGMQALTNALATSIDAHRVHVGAPLTQLACNDEGAEASIGDSATKLTVTSDFVVLALPPRVVDATVQFLPPLAQSHHEQFRSVSTWMAEHAKFVAIYKSPFWRGAGLSGDALSQRGPLTEIHDASPADGSFGALFGFVGIPAQQRSGLVTEMKSLAVQQLGRLFGDSATKPIAVHYKDWAQDRFTATPVDSSSAKPQGLPEALEDSPWNGRILFSGSETSKGRHHSNGYLEGAIESSMQTLQALKAALSSTRANRGV